MGCRRTQPSSTASGTTPIDTRPSSGSPTACCFCTTFATGSAWSALSRQPAGHAVAALQQVEDLRLQRLPKLDFVRQEEVVDLQHHDLLDVMGPVPSDGVEVM